MTEQHEHDSHNSGNLPVDALICMVCPLHTDMSHYHPAFTTDRVATIGGVAAWVMDGRCSDGSALFALGISLSGPMNVFSVQFAESTQGRAAYRATMTAIAAAWEEGAATVDSAGGAQ